MAQLRETGLCMSESRNSTLCCPNLSRQKMSISYFVSGSDKCSE